MTLPESVRRSRRPGTYVLGRAALSGKFSAPAPEPTPEPDPVPDDDSGKPAGKTFTQAELNKIAAKQKAEGKAAAEKAIADLLGCTPAEAAEIVKKQREAEDATKSEAEKERQTAAKERAAAEAAKREAAVEVLEARIERALAAEGFAGDDKKLARVRKMITVETGATYEDVLADVQDAKKEFPEIFAGKTPESDDGKKTGKLPSSDPAGRPPKPKSGEDLYAAGAKRFEEQLAKRTARNPLLKEKA
jgi:multidrug efflux pump subunit AcrA (membrane-fusion protein)